MAVWRREREEKRRVVSKLQQGDTDVEEKGEGEPLGDSQGPGVEMLLLMLLFPAVAAAIPILDMCKKPIFNPTCEHWIVVVPVDVLEQNPPECKSGKNSSKNCFRLSSFHLVSFSASVTVPRMSVAALSETTGWGADGSSSRRLLPGIVFVSTHHFHLPPHKKY